MPRTESVATRDGIRQMTQLINRLTRFLFLFLTVEALFSIPKLSWELAFGEGSRSSSLFGALCAGAALISVWRFRVWLMAGLRHLTNALDAISTGLWLGLCVTAGVLLRVLWVVLYPAPQRSDYATYFGLAKSLIQNHSYGVPNGGLAYWPPGYPFFLWANFHVFGVRAWVPVVANLFLFCATLFVVHALASRLADAGVSRLATLLLVFWPCYFASTGLASKEMLVLILLPLSFLIYAWAAEKTSFVTRNVGLFLAGILLGYTALTQPSLMLIPAVFFAYRWLEKQKMSAALASLVLVVFAMAIVILPWTLRNHRVLGVWVPISTNGGDVFYRANNPQATGGYTSTGEENLGESDEITRGKRGYQLGQEWIREHPGAFIKVTFRKQILFLGDDGHGVFETLKRGLGITDKRYLLWKAISNAYWWMIWILILMAAWPQEESTLIRSAAAGTFMLCVLYLYGIHSIFESGAKYHQPLTGILAMLAALAAATRSGNRKEKSALS